MTTGQYLATVVPILAFAAVCFGLVVKVLGDRIGQLAGEVRTRW